MKYLSVCSGIEAATVAWHSLGWDAVGFSEIEKFPSSVLAHHYPDVENYGDMNDFKRWPRSDGDVLVGGPPCQSFSVAGLRGGLADPRGNLALVYLAIAEHFGAERLVWENVPGCLSSDEGRDFGSLIGAMVELGYGVAWRVLDAQYFGVPQRRRRVFVVGSLRGWRDSAKILFEPESLRRNPPPSRGPRQGAAGDAAKSIRGSSGGVDREDMHTLIAPPITSTPYGDHDSRHDHLIPDVANPLTERMHKGINTTCDEGQTPIVSFNWQNGGGYGDANEGLGIGVDQAGPESASQVQAVAFNLRGREEGNVPEVTDQASVRAASGGSTNTHLAVAIRTAQTGANGIGVAEEVSHTLDGAQGQAIAFDETQITHPENRSQPSDLSPTLADGARPPTVAFTASEQSNAYAWESDVHPTLEAKRHSETSNIQKGIRSGMAVRRLTPLECERLQGFPDGYTNIPGASDTARYKALG